MPSSTATGGAAAPPLLSIVVPTKNERDNVGRLVERLEAVFPTVAMEIIFVDASTDATPKAIETLAQRCRHDVVLLRQTSDRRRGGLGGAVVQGLRAARAPWVCVMDADLQHPPELIAALLEEAESRDLDLVVASRYCDGGSAGGLGWARAMASRSTTGVARLLFPRRLRHVTDPMSGFFLVRRDAIQLDTLRPRGFKILLELLIRHPALRCAEVSFTFGERRAGRSKATIREGLRYLSLLVRTLVRFALADTWIWAKAPPSEVDSRSCTYDIHGIVTVMSETRLPELERFRVGELIGEPDIRVRVGRVSSNGDSAVRYREGPGRLGFAVSIDFDDRIEATASPLLRRSPHVLYTNVVEPILRWTFAARGYALVHAACLAAGEDAFLVTARTDTGKTTTSLRMLDRHPFSFLSDDLTLVSPDGGVLTYPKPLTISRHTLKAVKTPLLSRRERIGLVVQSRLHPRSGRRLALSIARTHLPAATINAIVQMIVPPPKYHVERLVPGVEVAPEARLTGLVVIQRGGEGSDYLDEREALETLMRNCEDAYGFPPYPAIEGSLRSHNGRDLKDVERTIVASALSGLPAAVMRSETMDWWRRVPAVVSRWTPAAHSREANSQAPRVLTGGPGGARGGSPADA